MTEEQKELLLKDISSRLPYGVKISIDDDFPIVLNQISYSDGYVGKNNECYSLDHFVIKPYLFPLSSMTDEQLSYMHFNTKFNIDRFGTITPKIDEDDFPIYVDMEDWILLYGWLNKNHFDYRGLIEKGLAIDATGLNNIY